ncbi:MAG: M24 family metallopeptidase [Proteobacteria bacterium]|nr:M24 family metallopeptidase [Pseudomonadota bacterium]
MDSPNFFWPWFSPEEYARRYALVRAGMEKEGFDCLLVYGISRSLGMEVGQSNLVYLTSVPSFSQSYLVVPLDGEPTMFVATPSHIKNIRDNAVIKDIRGAGSLFKQSGGMSSNTGPVIERLKELGLDKKRVGIVGDSGWLNINLPHEAHVSITESMPDTEFEVVTRWYENLKLVKSEEEIARMRQSAAVTDAVYDVMMHAVRPGVRPCDLYSIMARTAIEMNGRLALHHVGRTPMNNPDMDYPHFYPLTTPIEMGDVVMTEVGAGIGGYYGKIWGTFFMGDPTPEYEKMFELAVSTSHNLHAAIKPGVVAKDLIPLCLDDIQAAGYRAKTSISGWSTLNEPPDIRATPDSVTEADFVFQKNTCVSVTGWPVTDDEKMGVWLGDICLVTDDGAENLHKYPIRELNVIT